MHTMQQSSVPDLRANMYITSRITAREALR
jgi:hypothetical protein